ncbi:MAG: transaldolase [Solirubrobacterales bacterium]
MSESTRKLHDLGQSLWVDNITRPMLSEGVLKGYIDDHDVSGLTSNPTIFDKAISGGDAYDSQISQERGSAGTTEEIFFRLAIADLQAAADMFGPVHTRTDGVDGFVSLEVSPKLADDTEATIAQAAELHRRAGRPNLFIKIPGTRAGHEAISASIHAGIPVNVTLLFDREHYLGAAQAYMSGVERRIADGLDPAVPSVASLFVSRWDKAVIETVPDELRDRLGIAIGGRAYRAYRELLESDRWQALANQGARPQRLLWASTGTKDPRASDVLYIEALAAPFTVNTMPDETLKAFADHGRVEGALEPDGGDAEEVLAAFAEAGFDVAELAARLQEEGKAAFVDSWNELLASIERQKVA